MSIRCSISFESVEELRTQFLVRGPTCFVPCQDVTSPGESMELELAVRGVRLGIRGQILGSDFDEAGNVGLLVRFDPVSWKAACELEVELRHRAGAPELFAGTQVSGVPAPGDAEPPEILAPGHLVDDRFRIEAHIATGGMGEVYRAEHVHLRRPVALKMLRRALTGDAQMWGRFEREAQLVSKLENPHIVRVFDFGRADDGHLFLAMEFVEGETLETRLSRGPLLPAQAVQILAQVLDGLSEAHGLGVVHRDLKPANIIIGRRREGGERAKILDFGIARLSDAIAPGQEGKLTRQGVVVGTPAYLAPEQAVADRLDSRTDIYALGCVAYEMLTGQPPFAGEDLRKVIAQQLTAAPEDPVKLRPELRDFPDLCAAVLKALKKPREERFQTASEMSQALIQAIHSAGGQGPTLQEWVPAPSSPRPPHDTWQPAPPPPGVDDFFASVAAPALAPPAKVEEWEPPSPVAKVPHPASDGGADDFFAAVKTSVPPPRGDQKKEAGEGVFMRLEVLGPAPGSAQAQACLASVKEVVAISSGFLAAADEEGVTFGFIGRGGSPAGRATRAMLAAREAIAVLGQQLKPAASVRALVGQALFPMGALPAEEARRQLASGRANSLWIEQPLSQAAVRLCRLSSTQAPGLLACGAPLHRERIAPKLFGRRAVIDALDQRLRSAQPSVAAPLLLTGPSGSGHSSLARSLVLLASKRGALALCASSQPEEWGPFIELLCGAVGVHPRERQMRLGPALAALALPAAERQLALRLAGANPSPAAVTPTLAVHALRSVLRCVADGRSMVLAFDGLGEMDLATMEAVALMATRPAPRELLVGFSTQATAEGRFGTLQRLSLAPFSFEEVHRLLSACLGALAGPALTGYVLEHSRGLPRLALELLAWLDDGGLLMESAGTVELSEPRIEVPPAGAARAAIEAMPQSLRQLLQCAALLEEPFEWAILCEACPQSTPEALALLQASGWLEGAGSRWGRFQSAAFRNGVPPLPTAQAQAALLRCAASLVERARIQASPVDSTQLATHLTAGGAPERAVPVWNHAITECLARKDAWGASLAWQGLAETLAVMPPGPAQARARVDALARAAAQALVYTQGDRARMLLEQANSAASALQPPSPEYLLLQARVLRAEGRRVKAQELLTAAAQAAGDGPALPLVLTEHGQARELEGDFQGAELAWTTAHRLLAGAESSELARWHGEVDLAARLEARLAALSFEHGEKERAMTLWQSSRAKWRAAGWPFALARVASALGAALGRQQRFSEAAEAFKEASDAAVHCGDLPFQARALLQLAKSLQRQGGQGAGVRVAALEARRLASVLGWEEGRLEAGALLGG